MSREYLGAFEEDYQLGYATEKECLMLAIADREARQIASRPCGRCGQVHQTSVQEWTCSMREDQDEPTIVDDTPRTAVK